MAEERVRRRPRIVLIGMMGSGKTTVGRALSERTGWPYLDNDVLLGEATGRTARDLAAAGADVLRDAERQALIRALRAPPPAIIGAAAAAVLDADVGELLADVVVVWLRAAPATLASRAIRGSHRPWLDADVPGWLERTDAGRAAAYGALASMEIWTDALTPSEVADAIIDGIR